MNQEILSLRRNSADLQSVLMLGVLNRHGEPWAALPREVVSGSQGVESVIFEVVRLKDLTKPKKLRIGWEAIRPESLTLSGMPCLAVGLMGPLKNWEGSWSLGVLSVLGVAFFQVAVNLLNDVEDHLRFVDLPGSSKDRGVLQKGWMSAKQMRLVGFLALVLGILCGLPAVFNSPQVLFWIGATAVLGVLSFSNKPFGVKYRGAGAGEVCLFTLMGPLLTLGLSQALFGKFDLSIILIGLCFGFAAASISHASNLQDIEKDFQLKIKTLASSVGFNRSRYLLAGYYLLSFVTLWVGVGWGSLPLAVGLGSLLGVYGVVRLMKKVFRASGPESALLGSIRIETAKVHFILGVGLCLGLGIARFL